MTDETDFEKHDYDELKLCNDRIRRYIDSQKINKITQHGLNEANRK
jgi:hypothetical protein